jgi:pseudaminic acid synthase
VIRRPFITAELSANHLGSIDRALELVEAAASAGADSIKLQTWSPGAMALPGHVIESGPWAGRDLSELYEEAHTPWDWHKTLFDRAKALQMVGFSTPFDYEAVDFLEALDCPIYKIASFEVTDLPLVKRVGHTHKPMIISTGMATYQEIQQAVDAARSGGCHDITLLRCVSAYPAPVEEANLALIDNMRQQFQCDVGLSDHSTGIGVAVAAAALGAGVIEKHMTMDRNDGGPDAAFSLEPTEFAQMVAECRKAVLAIGTTRYGPSKAEESSMLFRRGLWVVRDLSPGDAFTMDAVKSLRPALGAPPSDLARVLGRRAGRYIKAGTPLAWEMIQ